MIGRMGGQPRTGVPAKISGDEEQRERTTGLLDLVLVLVLVLMIMMMIMWAWMMIVTIKVVWDDSGERAARERMRLEMEVGFLS